MSFDGFDLLDGPEARDVLIAQLHRFNTQSKAKTNASVPEIFSAWAERTPDACAARQADRSISYGALEAASNRVANLLRDHGIAEGNFVAVLLDDAVSLVTVILGILKAGGAYVPLDANTPYERMRYMAEDTRARAMVVGRTHIRRANLLQWDCPALDAVLCVDSDNIHAESEGLGEKMRQDLWDHVGRTMFDDISGGGWRSSFTGEWLSRMLSPSTRVLEIGCASGISLFRLAPLVGEYVGTDLSPEILARTTAEIERRGLANIRLQHCPAHEIDTLNEHDFDVVVINSVLQYFSGHNYLRDVIIKAVRLMANQGILFLGNVFDQELKYAFLNELHDFATAHPNEGFRTLTDYSEELFIGRDYLEDLRHDIPELIGIEYSPLRGTHESELSRFSFDAIIKINRTGQREPPEPRHKFQLDRRHLAATNDTNPTIAITPNALAYAIYTSGTSGSPKGVLIEHRSIVRLVVSPNYVHLGPDTRLLMTGALTFDASTFEIWAPLLNGGAFHRASKFTLLDPEDLRRALTQWQINTLWLTAGLFNQLVDEDPSIFAPLDQLLIGGERLSPPHVRTVLRTCPHLQLVNGYGPTENTTFTTCHRIEADFPREVPIGRPITGTEVLIVDGAGEYVPIGVPGEICAAGEGLARGYLNDPDLTARRFVPHPEHPERRMYRTGDRGRWTTDGLVEYLGRQDDQVKIRGYRVELGEVESALRELAPESDVVVAAVEPIVPGGTFELAAYLTHEPDLTTIRVALTERLPDYMVPAHLATIDRLPLNKSGKIDRRALPSPQRPDRGGKSEQPVNETERELAQVWREVLGTEELSVTDDFFELGGHSLKITKLVSQIQERLGVRVPLATVFEAPTVRDLSQRLVDAATYGIDLADEQMVILGGGANCPAIFALPPGTGDVLSYMPLAAHLPQVRLHAFNFIESPTWIEDYAAQIVAAAPEPYTLFGYSSGGNVAYHVAGALEAAGQRVSSVVMVDSGRTVSPYTYDETAVREAVNDFLEHESIKPYANTPLLRDKVLHKVLALYRFLSSTIDAHVLAADIHVVLDQDAQLERYHEGRLIASITAWEQATTGTFRTWQGAGDHNHMLHEPALSKNIKVLARLLR